VASKFWNRPPACSTSGTTTKSAWDDIAADAGVAKGTIYRYFQNKEDLYLGLILSSMNRFIENITPLMAGAEPAEQRLRTYIRHSFAFSKRYPYFLDLVQRVEGTADPKRLAPLQECRQRIFRIVADVIRDLNDGMFRQLLRFLPKPWPENLPDAIANQFLYGACPPRKRP
jgi:AcrR family transcriptional regulator